MTLNTKIQPLSLKASGLDQKSYKLLRNLSNPKKIQDYLNSLPFNFEKGGETNFSVQYALRHKTAHCFEGALIAAAALWIRGERPLLLDLVTLHTDWDHVVVLFNKDGYWGAISKTNHAVLRYRDPIYKSIRELVMSYFHEYFLHNGDKTLRTYSKPFDLSRLGTDWIYEKENQADLAHTLNKSPHTRVLTSKQIRNLRKADKSEIKAGKIIDYKK